MKIAEVFASRLIGRSVHSGRTGLYLEALSAVDVALRDLKAQDLEGYAGVRGALNVPSAGGECRFTRWGFHRLRP